jgi:hypothetical protein
MNYHAAMHRGFSYASEVVDDDDVSKIYHFAYDITKRKLLPIQGSSYDRLSQEEFNAQIELIIENSSVL